MTVQGSGKMKQTQICAICTLANQIEPEELTIKDIIAITKHLRDIHGLISEKEFEQWYQ